VVEVNTPSLDALKVSGGATVSGSGAGDSFTLEGDAGSDIDLSRFEVGEVELAVSEGAQVRLSVSEQASGSVTDGATVELIGDPNDVSVTVSGGGQLKSDE